MSFAEKVALKLKTELKIAAKPIEGFEDKDDFLLEMTPNEYLQIMAYKKGLTGRKYYLSWAMEFEQAKKYIPLVKKIEFDKEDFNKKSFENSLSSEGHIAITLKKNMLWHLVIRETSKLESITIGWVIKSVKDFLTKKHQLDSK